MSNFCDEIKACKAGIKALKIRLISMLLSECTKHQREQWKERFGSARQLIESDSEWWAVNKLQAAIERNKED